MQKGPASTASVAAVVIDRLLDTLGGWALLFFFLFRVCVCVGRVRRALCNNGFILKLQIVKKKLIG